MRLGIIASARHAIREPFAGGLEMHTHALATGLRRRGHEVTVFASAESDPELGVEAVCPRATGLDLSDAARQDPSMVSERFMEEHHAYLELMLRLRGHDFDVLQNSSLHYLPISMADALPFPVVTTLHTPPTPWLESAVTIAAGRAGVTFVSVSPHNAASWRTPVDEVIPNGVDLGVWPFSSDTEPDLAIWTGRLVPEKGPHLAVDAAHAAGMRIVLAGPRSRGTFVQDEVLPRLRDDDLYAGHLRQAELAALVGRAAVQLCTPCWDEPFGLVVPEALACGTPVAAFDRGAMSDVIDGSSGRLVPPGDVAALGAAAREAARLGRKDCRRRAEAEFSVESMVHRYEALYESLTA